MAMPVFPICLDIAGANPVRIASDIVSSWPENKLPETTEKEEGFILFTNLLYSIESGKDSFINFVDSMIGKINWNLEHKEFLEKNWY